jgi:hypothetical protein
MTSRPSGLWCRRNEGIVVLARRHAGVDPGLPALQLQWLEELKQQRSFLLMRLARLVCTLSCVFSMFFFFFLI